MKRSILMTQRTKVIKHSVIPQPVSPHSASINNGHSPTQPVGHSPFGGQRQGTTHPLNQTVSPNMVSQDNEPLAQTVGHSPLGGQRQRTTHPLNQTVPHLVSQDNEPLAQPTCRSLPTMWTKAKNHSPTQPDSLYATW
jgi:hypothetical protein